MPWITMHYPEFRKLKTPWIWHVVEGVAAPEQCTSWCRQIPPSLSTDGSGDYLTSLAFDPRVIVTRKALWRGKVAMVNAPLRYVDEDCILLQVDSDECWRAEQIETLVEMFKQHPEKNSAYFRCNYRLGANIVASRRGEYGNRTDIEWLRAWRFTVGQRFATHEPPKIEGLKLNPFTHDETEAKGLVFEHFAWATEEQVKWKCDYYGSPANQLGEKYQDGVAGWKRLQENTRWPTRLDAFLPWVGPNAEAATL